MNVDAGVRFAGEHLVSTKRRINTHNSAEREDKSMRKQKGACAGWYKGDNSTCRTHIACAHYEEYAARCKEREIAVNHRCVPKEIQEATAGEGKSKKQQTLEAMGVKKVRAPKEFSPELILKTVTEHVVCGYQGSSFQILRFLFRPDRTQIQPLAIADDKTFCNCLVVMRPGTKTSELPTVWKVKTRINNEFVGFLKDLKDDIEKAPGDISSLWDMWTAPHTSEPYFGLILQWVGVDEPTGTWTFRNEVGACHKVLGDHSGADLGRYFTLFLERAGVISKTHAKVSVISQHVFCCSNHLLILS